MSAVGCESRMGIGEPPGAAAWRCWLAGWLAWLAGWLAQFVRGVAAAWRRGVAWRGGVAWRVQSPSNPIWPSGNIPVLARTMAHDVTDKAS